MPLVLTVCTNRKRVPANTELRASALPQADVAAVAQYWGQRLREATARVPAARLYAGRGFQEAIAAAAHVGAELFIVSAGLGLIASDTLVPPYALSVVGASADSVLPRLTDNASAAAWWEALSAISPFGRSLADAVQAVDGVVIVALSEAYLAMVAPDLSQLPDGDRGRLRIITRAPVDRVALALRPYVMPYDDRLDGPDSPLRGTRGDFATRAARHFAQSILSKAPAALVDDHADLVRGALQSWRLPSVPTRVRHDDEALLAIIRKHWDNAGGQSSRLLRVLRDDLQIACEQGRFVGLMNRLRAEREAA